MSTYWPGRDVSEPEMHRYCRFCGFPEHVAERMVDGCEHHQGGHEYVEINSRQLGPVGPGTPAARMRWFWDALDPYRELLEREAGYNPISSRAADGMVEVAVIRLLEQVREDKTESD